MMGGGMMGGGMHHAHHAEIPDEYAGLSNPVAADDASIQRGGEIFAASCAVCHGDGGMGDGPAAASLDPPVMPIAHTSQMLSDAYLFWRISEGGQGDPLQILDACLESRAGRRGTLGRDQLCAGIGHRAPSNLTAKWAA